jgi:cytochrome b6-f complex iron-sulfur subunit
MTTRRKFVTTSAGVVLLGTGAVNLLSTLGCGGGGGGNAGSPTPTPVPTQTPVVSGGIMTLPLADWPALSGADGALSFNVAPAGAIIVAHLDAGTTAGSYICLSSTCTHQGCTVVYQASDNQFHCPCHGSVYTNAGIVALGPSVTPLHAYTTTFDGATVTVDLNS